MVKITCSKKSLPDSIFNKNAKIFNTTFTQYVCDMHCIICLYKLVYPPTPNPIYTIQSMGYCQSTPHLPLHTTREKLHNMFIVFICHHCGIKEMQTLCAKTSEPIVNQVQEAKIVNYKTKSYGVQESFFLRGLLCLHHRLLIFK